MRMPKLQEIFTTVAIVCHRYERLAVLQNVFASFCLERVMKLKNVSKKLHEYKQDKEEKKKRDKNKHLGLKKKILEQSRGTMRVCVSVLILF